MPFVYAAAVRVVVERSAMATKATAQWSIAYIRADVDRANTFILEKYEERTALHIYVCHQC